MANEMTPASQLRLPMQAAPVYRMPGPSALNGGSGIEASDFWSDCEHGLPIRALWAASQAI